ncbi:MAG: 4-(cytidine 5'-diphospho)-2-C-methyl-D-erythritol kinase [Clostridia bacterium]|nr:4-(cytidine 5'-diphospho)-2-C-methyl-D-erythritol kinase [Clostridia bacterium]
MKIRANAKINLTLDILGRRADGYHDLATVMQSVALYDDVTVTLNDSGNITVHTSSAQLRDDESNIAWKAAKAFFDASGLVGQGVSITIEKNIPMEAGMAGGSADGAAVIVALNRLCGKNFDDAKLWDIGATVGADIPFCITGGTMLAEGKGEILTPLPLLADFPDAPVILLCKPEVGVSTGKAYGAVDNCDPAVLSRLRPDTDAMCRALAERNLPGVAKNVRNVFEEVMDIGECAAIKRIMTAEGALGACMTGSGTTVFGLFDDAAKAEACAARLRETFPRTYLTHASSAGCDMTSE